jgi:hypothetical protein
MDLRLWLVQTVLIIRFPPSKCKNTGIKNFVNTLLRFLSTGWGERILCCSNNLPLDGGGKENNISSGGKTPV